MTPYDNRYERRPDLTERDRFLTSASERPIGRVPNRRARTHDLEIVCRQMATLLSAGVPLNEALSTVAYQAEDLGLRAALQMVRKSVLSGQSLAAALGTFAVVFPTELAELASEDQGSISLEDRLQVGADTFEAECRLDQLRRNARTFPMIACCVVGVLVIVMTWAAFTRSKG